MDAMGLLPINLFFFTENSSSRPFVVDSLECTRQVLVHNLRYPLRLTCNLRIHPWKGTIIFQTMICRFYVNMQGCMSFYLNIQGQMSYSYCCQPLHLFHLLKINNSNIPCVSLEARFLRSFRWKPTWEKIGELSFCVCVNQCLLLFDLIW